MNEDDRLAERFEERRPRVRTVVPCDELVSTVGSSGAGPPPSSAQSQTRPPRLSLAHLHWGHGRFALDSAKVAGQLEGTPACSHVLTRQLRLRLPPVLTRRDGAAWELPEGPGAHAKPRRRTT